MIERPPQNDRARLAGDRPQSVRKESGDGGRQLTAERRRGDGAPMTAEKAGAAGCDSMTAGKEGSRGDNFEVGGQHAMKERNKRQRTLTAEETGAADALYDGRGKKAGRGCSLMTAKATQAASGRERGRGRRRPNVQSIQGADWRPSTLEEAARRLREKGNFEQMERTRGVRLRGGKLHEASTQPPAKLGNGG